MVSHKSQKTIKYKSGLSIVGWSTFGDFMEL